MTPPSATLLVRPGVPSENTWLADAACVGRDLALFHPTGPDGRDLLTHERHVIPAARVCAGCPVRAECLDDARGKRDYYGVRAGLTGSERRRLRRSCRMCGLASPTTVCRVCRLRTETTSSAPKERSMHDVEFVDAVPAPRYPRHPRIARALRDRPRQWAVVARDLTSRQAARLASHIRTGTHYMAYRPMGAYQADVRDGTVYARYIGLPARTKERTA